MAFFRCEKSTKIFKKLLWANSSSDNFPAQTISLDLTKYDGVIVYSKLTASTTPIPTNTSQNYISKDGVEYWISMPYATTMNVRRSVTVTDTGVTFGNGIQDASTGKPNFAVPYLIYGYVYEPDMAIAEKKLLWNNPSPTSAFAAQTLSLDLSKYDGVIIRVSCGTNYNTDIQKPYQLFNYVPKDGTVHYLHSLLNTSGTSNAYWARQVTVTDTGITFSIAGYPASTLASNNASQMIPTEIYGYIYKDKIDEPDKRKFILKDGIFQGTQGTDYGVLGTLTQNVGFVTLAGGNYNTGIAPFISASNKTKYKRVVFDCDNVNAANVRMYSSTTETGSRTHVFSGSFSINLNTLSNDIFLYLMPTANMNYYNIYLE